MASEAIETLRTQLKQMRDKGLLPKGYAKIVAEKVGGKCTPNKVYHVFTGNNSDLEIMEYLIELAENSKLEALAKRAKKVLED